ncbi:MAG TPA: diacylglycerol kinase family protein [Thermoanaerobaculia bacterium]|nr:diacylglycerol kinase family protein [Thermoanaerobaculia bacterium]
MKTLVILNPKAGGALDDPGVRGQLAALPDTVVRETTAAGHAERLAREAIDQGFERVVAAGGDGTMNEVLNGLAPDFSCACLGVLPVGTGNDFVRSIGVPDDVEAALEVLRRDRRMAVDVARAVSADRTRYFLNMSAGGFSKEVDAALDPEVKARWGALSYFRSAAQALPELTAYQARVTVDDEVLEVSLFAMVVANARYVASGIKAAPSARLDDGRLDVLIFPEMPVGRLAMLVPRALLGLHEGSDQVIVRRAREVEVASEPPITFNVDGELMGDEPIRFTLFPRALQMVVGRLEQEDEDAAAATADGEIGGQAEDQADDEGEGVG